MNHEVFMNRCFHLAELGLGTTYPNPLVGAVIVYDEKIIGEGWHQKAGLPHAEINAINSVKDKFLLQNSTLYVNLEPCNHVGRTGACSKAIVAHKIPRVVFAQSDSAKHLQETGATYLKSQGVEVTSGILEDKAIFINRRFNKFHTKKRPYIILKWAETQNGYFAPKGNNQQWISSKASKQLSHKWRAEEEAILIGANTAVIDNPRLDIRLWDGDNPIKIVIDADLKVSESSLMFDKDEVLVYNQIQDSTTEHVKQIKIDFKQNPLQQILEDLYKRNISSVIIEGGIFTLQSFINENLWDEYRIFKSPNYWEDGLKAPELPKTPLSIKKLGTDELLIGYNGQ